MASSLRSCIASPFGFPSPSGHFSVKSITLPFPSPVLRQRQADCPLPFDSLRGRAASLPARGLSEGSEGSDGSVRLAGTWPLTMANFFGGVSSWIFPIGTIGLIRSMAQSFSLLQEQFVQAGAGHVGQVDFRGAAGGPGTVAFGDVLPAAARRLNHLIPGARGRIDDALARGDRGGVNQGGRLKTVQSPKHRPPVAGGVSDRIFQANGVVPATSEGLPRFMVFCGAS